MSLISEKNTKNRTNAIIAKLAATQNVMKNKFEKAYTNRIEHETKLDQAIEPLKAMSSTASMNKTESESPKKDVSLRNLSESKNIAQQLRLATKSYSNHAMNSRPIATSTTKIADSANVEKKPENDNIIRNYSDNPNELCDRLRLLLTSQLVGVNQIEEINTIISKLHDLDILI